jgi:uncharacterized membrane-anchored protein
MSDYLDRTLGLGYIKSSLLLLGGVLAILFAWRTLMGQVRFENISRKPDELFYWVTIVISNTLGTALGDFVATDAGLGFERSAVFFAVLLGIVLACYFFTTVPKSILFWSAYVLTRPLGATLGDTLTKPHSESGFELDRITSSLVIAGLMIVMIFWVHGRSGDVSRQFGPAQE